MITDALLGLFGAVLDFIVGLLPESTLELPTGSSVAAWFGTYGGPADRFVPMVEAMIFLELMLNIYLPIALTYTITKWVYKHLPIVGKG